MGIVEEVHNVRLIGSGEQVVAISHSFGSDPSVWKYVVPYLLENYRVIIYDNTGDGSTNPDYYDFDRYSSIDGYVNDWIAILDELQVKSCVFVGHSIKSMVGAMVSICRPALISKLVMLCATPRILNDEDYHGGFNQEEKFEGMHSNYRAWCTGFAPIIVGGDMTSEAVQEVSRTLFNMRPDIALNLAQLIFLSDLRDALPFVKVPGHILQSSNDEVVPVSVANYINRNIRGPSVIKLMPTYGHLPQLSSPGIIIPLLLKHIGLDIT